MLERFAFDSFLHRVGQEFVGAIHAVEVRVAAGRRDLQRVKDARLRRILQVRHVRVPGCLAGAQASDGRAIFHDVGDDVNFGMPFDEAAPGFLNRRPIQISESFAERDQIVIGQILSAEQKNRMVEPGSIDAREIIRVNRSQIDSLNFRSERLSRGNDGDARLLTWSLHDSLAMENSWPPHVSFAPTMPET